MLKVFSKYCCEVLEGKGGTDEENMLFGRLGGPNSRGGLARLTQGFQLLFLIAAVVFCEFARPCGDHF